MQNLRWEIRKKAKEAHLTQNDGMFDRREGSEGKVSLKTAKKESVTSFGPLWQCGEA